jgi:hypothetical protein
MIINGQSNIPSSCFSHLSSFAQQEENNSRGHASPVKNTKRTVPVKIIGKVAQSYLTGCPDTPMPRKIRIIASLMPRNYMTKSGKKELFKVTFFH